MIKPNQDLRAYAKAGGVFLWQVADAFGIHINTLQMQLRREFTQEQKDQFMRKVDELARANEGR